MFLTQPRPIGLAWPDPLDVYINRFDDPYFFAETDHRYDFNIFEYSLDRGVAPVWKATIVLKDT